MEKLGTPAIHQPEKFRGSSILTNLAADRGNLLDNTPSLQITHGLHGLPSHIDQPEEVDFHLLPDLIFCQSLKRSTEAVTGVVHDYIDALELLDGYVKSPVNGVLLRDIEIHKQTVGIIGAVKGELGRVAGRGDDVVAFLEHDLDEFFSEASRAASNQKNAGRHDSGSQNKSIQVFKQGRGTMVDSAFRPSPRTLIYSRGPVRRRQASYHYVTWSPLRELTVLAEVIGWLPEVLSRYAPQSCLGRVGDDGAGND